MMASCLLDATNWLQASLTDRAEDVVQQICPTIGLIIFMVYSGGRPVADCALDISSSLRRTIVARDR
jgi:hypothetical protein